LSIKTIETYREHIKYKQRLSSGAQLMMEARRAAQHEGLSGPPLPAAQQVSFGGSGGRSRLP
jgi:hypothetical protein